MVVVLLGVRMFQGSFLLPHFGFALHPWIVSIIRGAGHPPGGVASDTLQTPLQGTKWCAVGVSAGFSEIAMTPASVFFVSKIDFN